MNKIEINTTQNVTIQYDLAGLHERILAFLLDSVIIYGALFIITISTAPFMGAGFMYISYFILVPIFFFYTVLFEILNDGQTPGKKVLKLKVVKTSGKEAELSDFLIRWVFRTVDIFLSFGAIAAIFISSTDKNQRLGDLLANTTVIKDKPPLNLRLEDILNISTKDTHTPTYPLIKKFKEEEMLVVKNVIDRVSKYPNTAHRHALSEMVNALKFRLGLAEVQEDDVTFLKTLIKDYIVLTR